MLWNIAEMWLVALVVVSALFVGVVAFQAVVRQLRTPRSRSTQAQRVSSAH